MLSLVLLPIAIITIACDWVGYTRAYFPASHDTSYIKLGRGAGASDPIYKLSYL